VLVTTHNRSLNLGASPHRCFAYFFMRARILTVYALIFAYLAGGIFAAPTITTQPNPAINATSGWTNVNFTVAATATSGTLSYQWKKDGVALTNGFVRSRTLSDGRVVDSYVSGATGSTLTLVNVSPSDAGSYTVDVTDSSTPPTVTSNAAVLTVTDTAPTLVNQSPATAAVSEGGRAKLFFTVNGSRPLNVQWFKDGVALKGVNGSSTTAYDIDNFSAAKAGSYTVTVSNAYGTVSLQPMALQLAATKDPLDLFRWTNPDPQGNNLISVNAVGGKLVLVGRGGAVISTVDGQSGNIGTGGTGFTITTVSYDAGRGVYLAGGGFSTLLRSTDAQNWTPVGLTGVDESYNSSATNGDGTIIMVGSDANVRPFRGLVRITRDGGNTWTLPTSTPAGWAAGSSTVQLTSAAFGNGAFVVVSSLGTAFRSTDGGDTWTQVTTGVTQPLQTVAFGNGTFVAVGNSGTIIRSTDSGVTWTTQASTTTNNLIGVNYLPASSTWVAVGAGATVRMSTDGGATWSTPAGTLAPNATDFYSIAESGALTAITGQYGRIFLRPVATTFDLNGWEAAGENVQIDQVSNTNNGGFLNHVDWDANSNQFLAVGSTGHILSAQASGSGWFRRAQVTAGGFLTQWVRFGNALLASGSSGSVLRSTDNGSTWTAVTTSATGAQLNGIAVGGGRVVVVGAGGAVSTSTDGTTWAAATSGVTVPLRRVTYANGQFVAVGGADNGSSIALLTSPDGLNWTIRTTGTTGQLWGVDYADGAWLAVGAASINGGGGFVLRSTDNGVTWTRTDMPGMSFLFSIRYLNSRWIATGSPAFIAAPNAFAVSSDGQNWTLKAVPASPNVNTLRSIAASPGGAYVLVGNDATILTSGILPPIITSQPASSTVGFNGGVSLVVSASSPFPLTYQWRRNGVNIPGATGNFYFVGNFDSSKAGTYDVVVTATRTDGDGNSETSTVTSAGAILTLGSGSGVTVSDWNFNRAKFWSLALPGRVTAAPGGKVYATFNNGGFVNAVDGQLVGAVIRLNADGTRDTTFNIGTALADAYAVVPLSDGRVLVGGVANDETAETGQTLFRVFRFNADGSRDWNYFSPVFTAVPRYMTVQSDGKLLVAPGFGGFTNNGGLSGLVRLNENGSLDFSFQRPSFPPNNANPIFAQILVDGAGKIYIAGGFTSVNGAARAGVARLNSDGSLDTTYVPSGYTFGGQQIRGLGLQTQGANAGKLIVAGGNMTVGGAARSVIRLGTDGALDTTFGAVAPADVLGTAGVRPRLLNLLPDDRVMVVSDRIVRLTADGVVDSTYANPTLSTEIFWLETLADGSVLFPPEFGTSIGGSTPNTPVRLTPSGARDTTFNPGRFQTAVYPRDYSVQSDGKVLVWGAFDTVNSSSRPGFARLNADGSLDTLTLTGVNNLYTIASASVLSDGRLLAVTQTGSYRTNVAQGLARFNTDGTVDSSFVPASGIDPANLYLLPDNKALTWSATAQNLVNGNGVSFRRLTVDGAIDSSFTGLGSAVFGRVYRNPTTNAITEVVLGQFRIVGHYADGRALAVATVPDSAYAAGSTSLPVTLLRLNTDGTIDSTFNAPSINWLTQAGFTTSFLDPVTNTTTQWNLRSVLGSPFSGVVPQTDGSVIVFGAFTNLGGNALPGIARLTNTGAVDLTFSVGTGPEVRNPQGRNPLVQAVAVAADGKIWVAGNFDTFGGRSAPGLTRLNADGSVDTTFVAGARYVPFLGNGSRITFGSGGTVYLSGTFATNSQNPDALARLVAAPAALSITNQPTNITVTAGQTINLGVQVPVGNYQWQWRRNGVAIPGATGGGYNIPNASRADADRYDVVITDGTNTVTSAPIIVRVAPTAYPGTLIPDVSFNPNPLSWSSRVNHAVQLGDGKWFVAGDFTSWNGTPRTFLAKLNADYSLDTSFVPPEFSGQVYAVAPAADGSVYVGGEFNRVGPHTVPGLVRLTSTGALDLTWGPQDNPPNASVVALALTADNKLLVSRQFTLPSQVSVTGTSLLRRLNANGTLDTTFTVDIAANGQRLNSVIAEPSGAVAFAGVFSAVNGTTRYGLARVSSTGALDTAFGGATGASSLLSTATATSSTVFSLTRAADGRYLATGTFQSVGGVDRNRSVILNADGTVNTTYVPAAPNSTVLGGSIQADGKVVLTGLFTQVGTSATYGMVRLAANGAIDTLYTGGAPTVSSFAGTTASRPMYLFPQADGTTALFGSFQSAFNQRRVGIAVVGTDNLLTATAPIPYRPAFSNNLYPRRDGRFDLFGSVETFGSTTGLNQAVRFNPNGTVDSSFPVGTGFTSNGLSTFGIYRAVRLGDGGYVASGDFLGYNGTNRPRLLRLNSDGTADTAYNAPIPPATAIPAGPNQTIVQLLPLRGGAVLLGGFVSFNYNGTAITGQLARINADGSRDTNFTVQLSSSNSPVPAILNNSFEQADGKIVLAGSFTHYGPNSTTGNASSGLVRINADGTYDSTFAIGTGVSPGSVNFITGLSDGRLVVAGNFVTFNGASVNRMVVLNANGSRDTTFTAPAGLNNIVSQVIPQEDGKFLVFGDFTGTPTPGAVRLNANGTIDSSFALAGATGGFGSANRVVMADDGSLYVHLNPVSVNYGAPVALARFATGTIAPATIVTQPQSVTAGVGDSFYFSVTPGGNGPHTFQWFRNGTAITGATGSILRIANATAADLANYTVTVTNAAGSVTSNAAIVNAAPIILSQPAPRKVVQGGKLLLRFGVAGGGLTYTWTKNGTPVGGNSPDFVVDSAQPGDAGTYVATASGGLGTVQSNPVVVTVSAPDAILWNQFSEASTEQAPSRLFRDGQGNLYVPWSVSRNPDVAAGRLVGALARFNENTGALDLNFKLDRRLSRVSWMERQSDGKLLIAVQTNDTAYVVRTTDTGAIDPTFSATYFGRGIRFIKLQPDGKVIVAAVDSALGGSVSTLAAALPGIYRLNSDGTLDGGFTPAILNDFGNVFGPPEVDASGRIYLAGGFTSVGGVARTNVARLNADGTVDTAFAATLPAGFGSVQARSVALQSDGRAVFFGDFRTTARGTTQNAIFAIRFNTDGTYDSTFGQPLRLDLGISFGRARFAVVHDDDSMVLVGDRLVRLTSNGVLDPSFTRIPFDREGFWVTRTGDGRYLVPDLTWINVNGVQQPVWGNGVAAFAADGTPDLSFQLGGYGRSAVPNSGRPLSNGDVWLAGSFNRYGALAVPGVAKFTSPTAAAPAQTMLPTGADAFTIANPNGYVTAAAGDQTYVVWNSGALARLNPDGSTDGSFVPVLPAGYNAAASSLFAAPGGGVILAQSSITAVSALAGNIGNAMLRLNSNGSRDPGFTPNLSSFAVVERTTPTSAPTRIATGGINVAQVLPDGRLLVIVSSIDGTLKIQRLNADGSLDSGFNAPSFGAITPSIGFTTATFDPVSGQTAQWNQAIYQASDLVRAAVQMPDGKVYVGGRFTLDGSPRGLVRLNTDGTLDTTFTGAGIATTLTDVSPYVSALTADASGRLYVAGRFSSFNGTAVPGLFRLLPNGTLDAAWAPGFGVYELPTAAATLTVANNRLYVFGTVATSPTAQATPYASVALTFPPTISTQPAASVTLSDGSLLNLFVGVTGTGPFTYQWFLNGTAITGATGSGYSVPQARAANAGTYTVAVTSAGGTTVSNASTVTVNSAAPAFNARGNIIGTFGYAVAAGTSATLTANPAAGSLPITYQWRFNGVDIPGATNSTYTVLNWQPENAGAYSYRATNAQGTATSPNETFSVSPEAGLLWSNPRPTGNGLTGVIFANNRFTIGGLRGTLLTSLDGLNWSAGNLTGTNNIAGFAFGNGTYVGIGTLGATYYSNDGLNWEPAAQRPSAGAFNDVVYHLNRFVAVGTEGVVGTSTDGRNWTFGQVAGLAGGQLFSVMPDDDRYLVLTTTNKVLASTDGLTWTEVYTLPGEVNSIAGSTAPEGGAVVVGPQGRIYSTNDGVTWTQRTSGVTQDFVTVRYLNNQYIAVGLLGTLVTSPDGITWTVRTSGTQSHLWDVDYGLGRYVVTGQGGNNGRNILTSTDGVTWTSSITGPYQGTHLLGVATNNTITVAVGNGGAITTSTDLSAWTGRNAGTTGNLSDVVFGGGRFVAISSTNGAVTSSTDGLTWALQTTTGLPASGLQGIAYEAATSSYVIVGDGGSIRTSPDLATWTTRTSPTGAQLRKVTVANNKIVAVSGAGEIITADNSAATWTRTQTSIGRPFNDVAFGNGVWVAVGQNAVYTSTDATTWTDSTFNAANLLAVEFIQGNFIAFSNNHNYFTSTDGLTWQGRSSGAFDAMLDAAIVSTSSGLRFVGVGNFGTILTGGMPTMPGTRNISLVAGQALDLNAHVSGSPFPVTYTWTKGGTALSGQTSYRYLVNSVAPGDAGTYVVTAGNSFGATTQTFIVTVNTPPSISAQPTSTNLPENGSVLLTVTAGGTGPFTYQWFRDGVALANQVASVLNVTAAGSYTVRVTSAFGTVTSSAAVVTVVPSAPVLFSSPSLNGTFGPVMASGTAAALTPVIVQGTRPMTFQWSFNGTDIPGATNESYYLPAWTADRAGVYSVRATNALGVSNTVAGERIHVTTEGGWRWRNPTPTGNGITRGAFINGQFLLGGLRGTILTSTDGLSWTPRTIPAQNNIFAFRYVGNRYVAMGSLNAIFTSPDAITWTPRNLGIDGVASQLQDMTLGANGRLVAVGTAGVTARSDDAGETWTVGSLGAGVTDSVTGATFTLNRYFAASLNAGRIFSSPDGISWTATTVPATSLRGLAYGAGRLVAVGGAGAIVTSADGTTWAATPSGTTNDLLGVNFLNGRFIAVGVLGTILTSTDGLTWTTRASAGNQSLLQNTTFGNGRYVIVGQAGPTGRAILTSTDAVNWTVTIGGPRQGTNLNAVAASSSTVVAVGNAAAVVSSTDKVTWTDRTAGAASTVALNDVVYNTTEGRFVAVGTGGVVTASTDGATWALQSTSSVISGISLLGLTVSPAIEGGTGYVAVGTGGSIFTTTNFGSSTTWIRRTSGTTAQLRKVIYGGGLHVAVGQSGTVVTSADAATWTARTSGTTVQFNDVAFGSSAFVAVGGSGTVVRSIDGTSWSVVPSFTTANLVSVKFHDGVFIATSNSAGNAYYVSTDGLTWSGRITGAFDPLLDTESFQGEVVGVGAFGTIMTAGTPIVEGVNTTLTATAGTSVRLHFPTWNSAEPVNYTWTKDSTAVSGAPNGPTLVIPVVDSSHAGVYRITASNSKGATQSATITLALNIPLSISAHPQPQTALVGGSASFSVTATGTPAPTYQWRRNGLDLIGQTGSTLNLSNLQLSDTGSITVAVRNAFGTVVSNPAALTVNPIAPVIQGPLSAFAVANVAFTYQIGTNATPATFSATGLPAGLTLNAATGVISGTPTVAPGTYNVQVTATNVTSSDTQTLVLTVQAPAPVITSLAAVGARVGVAFSYTITATNSPTSFLAFSLPPGLTLSGATISGTPTAAGFYSALVAAANATGLGSQPLAIQVAPPLNAPVYSGPVNLSGTAGSAFTFTPNFGAGVASWALVNLPEGGASTLPTGITLNTSTGVISGTTTQSGTFRIALQATSTDGVATTQVLSFTFNPPASAPLVTSSGSASGTVGSAFSFSVLTNPTATTFAATGLPAGLTINTSTGVISGTPTEPGISTVSLTVGNLTGSSTTPLTININSSALAPVITNVPVAQGTVGTAFNFAITASNSPTAFVVTSGSLPAGLTLNGTTGVITGTPTAAGQVRTWIAASNVAGGRGPAVEMLFDLARALTVPVITSNGSAAGQVGKPFQYQTVATNSPTSYAVTGTLPAGLTFNTTTGVLSGLPSAETTVPVDVTLTATNGDGTSGPKVLSITIAPPPATPRITSSLTAGGRSGVAFSYQITASENPTSYASGELPAGLTLNTTTGAISGTPTVAGTFDVAIRAANAAGLGQASTLTLTLAAPLAAPAITSNPTADAKVGVLFSYQITATNSPTGFNLTGTLPPGLSLNTATGVISGNPADNPGLFIVTLTAANNTGTSQPQQLILNVAPADNTPVITSATSATGQVGVAFSYQITATNVPNTSPLPASTFLDAVGLPPGLAVNPSTGLIQGTPNTAGTFTTTLVGINPNGTGPMRSLTITVSPAATAPVIGGSLAVNAQAGTAFSYQIVASNNPTSYGALDGPVWLGVNTATGVLGGTPTGPGTFALRLTASNSGGTSNEAQLLLTVFAAPNTPVVNSTNAATGRVGQAFSYQIAATNTPTSYLASGMPPGLTLDAATGIISGTPTRSDTYLVKISAVNANGEGNPVTLTITISPSLVLAGG